MKSGAEIFSDMVGGKRNRVPADVSSMEEHIVVSKPNTVSKAVATVGNAANTVTSMTSIRALFDKLFNPLQNAPGLPSGPGFVSRGKFYPVHPLTGSDTNLLQEFFSEGLSDESRFTRFLSVTPHVSNAAVQYLANRDGRYRVALVALDPTATHIVGMAEYAFSERDDKPEVAFAVADDYQNLGICQNLISMLATLSFAGGYSTWVAEVMISNAAPKHLLSQVGHVYSKEASMGVESLEVELEPNKFLGNELTKTTVRKHK